MYLLHYQYYFISISNCFIAKERWYPFFFRLARIWSKFILIGMGFGWKITKLQKLEKGKSYMFIANHTSMIDIMLMLVTIKR